MNEDNVARVVAHMLRTAKPGDELYDDMVRGPETEDTTCWVMTASGDVEVPAVRSRTLTKKQAHDELVARIRTKDDAYVPYLEKKWGVTK